jgi:hypothetical protein
VSFLGGGLEEPLSSLVKFMDRRTSPFEASPHTVDPGPCSAIGSPGDEVSPFHRRHGYRPSQPSHMKFRRPSEAIYSTLPWIYRPTAI